LQDEGAAQGGSGGNLLRRQKTGHARTIVWEQ